MHYIIATAAAATTHAITNRFNKARFSHILFSGYMAADVTLETELAKLIVDLRLSGAGIERNIVSSVPMSDFCHYSNIMGGVVGDAALTAATGQIWRAKVPIGDLNLDKVDLVYKLATSSAFAQTSTIRMVGIRETDNEPIIEYQRRNITTDGASFGKLLLCYDVASAYNDTVESRLTFEDNSQATIVHGDAYHELNITTQVESDQAWALIYADKDMHTGREIKILPTTAFDAFIVQLSALNGLS